MSLSESVYSVLNELADGQIHSGQSLGGRLRVSRTAVWQAVQYLGRLGVAVDAVPGKGYRLHDPLELLSYERIMADVDDAAKARLKQWFIFPSIDSTNSFLRQRRQKGDDQHAQICLAEMQTQGRGRRGRHWVSPFGCNIYFSLSWCFNRGLDGVIGLGAAVAVMLLESLQQECAADFQLKWPNDVVCRGDKLAGILIEASGEAGGECRVIIGVGVNVAMPAKVGDKPWPIDQAWTHLQAVTGRRHSRNKLIAGLLNHLVKGLEEFAWCGLQPFLPRWKNFDMFDGRQVRIESAGSYVGGLAQGIDEFGALIVKTTDGLQRFHLSDASVRLQKH